MRLDCNALVGNWPFRKFRCNTIEGVEKLHKRFNIDGGFVSSAEAIFYNDPLEADFELAKQLEGKDNYRQIITVNPALPGTVPNIKRALRELNPAGVRIYPNYHEFKIISPEMDAIAEICSEHKLPLYITFRMDDPRCEYIIKSRRVPIWDVLIFCQNHKDFPIVLCNVRCSEVSAMKGMLSVQDNVCVDACGLKELVFNYEPLYEKGLTKQIVYGSCMPLYTLSSSVYLIDLALVPDEEKERVMSAKALIDILDDRYKPIIK